MGCLFSYPSIFHLGFGLSHHVLLMLGGFLTNIERCAKCMCSGTISLSRSGLAPKLARKYAFSMPVISTWQLFLGGTLWW